MAYFAPYIDETGLHMPTYEDRLSALCDSYRSIFGLDAELSESVPDYQLLSVFARALDDTSALVLSAFNSRNPLLASGQALDLLLPMYGLARLPGETDAAARSRIMTALSGNGRSMADNIEAEIRKVPSVRQTLIHINDSDTTDAQGVPAHSICCLVQAGKSDPIAAAIFRKKAPGIGTYGSMTKTVVDDNGVSHAVSFSRPNQSYVTFSIHIILYDGYDPATAQVMKQAVADYMQAFQIGQSLIVPSVYGICYAAAGAAAPTFAITDITATCSICPTTRLKVPAEWDTLLTASTGTVDIIVNGQ